MNIGVIGAGAWGTALAQVLARDGRPVRLWAREADVVTSINTGGSGGEDRLTENVSLNFAKIKVEYKEQTKTGGSGTSPNMTYSFLDIQATLVGPGGAINLGSGAALDDEGISITPTSDVFADYRYIGTTGLKFQSAAPTGFTIGEHKDGSHNLMVGVRFAFGH